MAARWRRFLKAPAAAVELIQSTVVDFLTHSSHISDRSDFWTSSSTITLCSVPRRFTIIQFTIWSDLFTVGSLPQAPRELEFAAALQLWL
mmetsp:Transcript_24679/g.62946  ORF Transcript_24679/g.62946 Transcript_24679/m.62946 type:complete len:90 (+) Transcript_24679:161-430(+)